MNYFKTKDLISHIIIILYSISILILEFPCSKIPYIFTSTIIGLSKYWNSTAEKIKLEPTYFILIFYLKLTCGKFRYKKSKIIYTEDQ